jgi:O-antigen/teichoic acid export membrane protein
MKLSTIVIRNSAYGLAAQIAIKILSFIFSVAIIRHLGAESYGQYSAIIAFSMVFAIISDLGLSPYFVREVARIRDHPDKHSKINNLFSDILSLRIVLSLIAIAITVSAAWLTGRPTIMLVAIGLNSLGLILYSIQGISEAALAGFERFGIASLAKVISQIIFVTLGAIALILGLGYFGLIIAGGIGVSILTYMCWKGVKKIGVEYHSINTANWFPLLRASIPFGLIGFALGFSYKFDTILINVYQSDAQTGYYNAAYNLIFSAVVISNVINTSLYPSLTRRAAQTPLQMPSIYEQIFRYLLVISLPITAGGFILSKQIISFLYSSEYSPSIQALQILIWVIPFMYLSEYLGYIVVINDHESRVARAILVATGVNIFLNFLFIPKYGLIAASIITVFTEAIIVCQHIISLRTTIKGFHWIGILTRPIIATLLMAAIVNLINPYFHLALIIFGGAISYIFFLFIFGVIGRKELSFLLNLKRNKHDTPNQPSILAHKSDE